jgi:hypothetical protein
MPIILGTTTTLPRWNSCLLFTVWLFQFIIIACFGFLIVLIGSGGFGMKPGLGERLYAIPFVPYNRETISPNEIADKD